MTRFRTCAAVSLVLCLQQAVAGDELDALLAKYKSHGLPLPPASATLCAREVADSRVVNGKRVRAKRYYLAFALEPLQPGKQIRCMVGIHEWKSPVHASLAPVTAKAAVAARVATMSSFDLKGLPSNVALATALQCKARGLNQLADHLFHRSRQESAGDQTVEGLAWQYWRNLFATEEGDRKDIVARLRGLCGLSSLGTQRNKQLVADMELTIAPMPESTDELEAVIDSLVHYAGGPEPVRTLKLRGFDAVPALLRHLDDARLTREIWTTVVSPIRRASQESPTFPPSWMTRQHVSFPATTRASFTSVKVSRTVGFLLAGMPPTNSGPCWGWMYGKYLLGPQRTGSYAVRR